MTTVGTLDNPLRVAIIGSGPSGFYAAEALFKSGLTVDVDMYDRLPTPFGLVRGGVAPDHDKIKTVTKVYEKIADNPHFRFFGNVTFGKDITHQDLKLMYHQIIYAVGAQTDRRLGIPGEDLAGSFAATEFVGWYNGHPDYRDLDFDLSVERVIVVGNGNVAMDVARILAETYDELYPTDIADYALEKLKTSKVKEIVMLGRRGPAQAAFTNPELKEFGELKDADVVVTAEELELSPLVLEDMKQHPNPVADKNLAILREFVNRPPSGKSRRIVMRFLVSPAELLGTDRMEAIKIVKNQLERGSDGTLKARAIDQYETIPAGMIFRSIGYMGVPLPDVPFDQKKGIIPNQNGRVTTTDGAVVPNEYVVGWIKRGPSGIIGTNKPDSVNTVKVMLEDVPTLPDTPLPRLNAVEAFVKEHQPYYVSLADWRALDQLEINKGKAAGRNRVKFTSIDDMLVALHKKTEPSTPQA